MSGLNLRPVSTEYNLVLLIVFSQFDSAPALRVSWRQPPEPFRLSAIYLAPLPSVFTVMVPTAVCLLPLCVSVWMQANKRAKAHARTTQLHCLFIHLLFHPLPALTTVTFLSPQKEVYECACLRGIEVPLVFVCLTLVALVPSCCCWTKPVVSPVTKAASLSVSLCLSTPSSLFSHTLHAGW